MTTPNNFRVKSGLNVGTTIAGGNTTITGFANVSTSVNSALLTVGSSFIANSTGVTTTGFANVATTLAAGNTTITGDITVSGNLTINGTTTNINSTNLVVEDKNIILADVTTPTDVTADGGGITLKGGTDKTLNWIDATDSWTSSEHLDIASGKTYRINGTTIANSTALGTGILASSLTSVGTLSSLTLGGAVSGITTLAAGNTTITGFANVTTSVNSAALSVGTNFIANTTQVTIAAGVKLSANGGVGTAGQVLASNGATGSPYWMTASSVGGSNTHIQFNDSTSSNGSAGFIFDKTSNNVTVGNTVTATHFDSVSDIILKENITSISNSMYYINNMHPVSYNWISTGEKSYGFIAQDVENILPDIVHIKEDGTKTISYYQIIPFLLSALKDQQKELSEIKLLLGNLMHNKE